MGKLHEAGIRAKEISTKKQTEDVEKLAQDGEDEEDEEEFVNPFEYFAQMSRDMGSLENRGIIMISGEISKDSLARATRTLLRLHFDKEFNEEVQIIINSPGGYTDAGWAFIDMMDFVNLKIRTIAMGEICSMATSIFVSGDERIMSPNSCAMIHQFSWGSQGTYSDLVAQRKAEDMEHKREIGHLIRHSKYNTEEEIRKHVLLDTDHWLTPSEMLKHGLCDEVFTSKKDRGKKKPKKATRKAKVKKKRKKE